MDFSEATSEETGRRGKQEGDGRAVMLFFCLASFNCRNDNRIVDEWKENADVRSQNMYPKPNIDCKNLQKPSQYASLLVYNWDTSFEREHLLYDYKTDC